MKKKLMKFAALTLAACMSFGSAANVMADEGTEEIELEFWHLTDEATQPVFDRAITRFENDHPGVKVVETMMDSDTYKTKLKVVMGSSEAPDVFMSWGGNWLGVFVEEGKVLDITDKIDTVRDEYMPASLGLSQFDGRDYGIATNVGPSVVYYNKEIYEELGLEIPETYEELTENCEKIKEAGYIPFALGNKNKWPGCLEFIYQALRIGGKDAFLNALNRTGGSFADETFVEAGEHIADYLEKGYYPDGTNGIDNNVGGSRMLFYSGKAAMFIMTNTFLGNCKGEDPEFYENNLGLFAYPMVEGGKGNATDVLAGGNSVSISSDCQNPDLAFELIYYVTNKDFSQDYIDTCSIFNGAKGVTITDELAQKQFDILGAAEYSQHFYDQALPPELGELHKDTTQSIYGKSMTPQEAAEAMEAKAKEILDK